MKKNYSPKEVAAMIGHDASTVNRWCRDGRIAASKPFGRWVIGRAAMLGILFGFGLLSGESLKEYTALTHGTTAEVRAEPFRSAMPARKLPRASARPARDGLTGRDED